PADSDPDFPLRDADIIKATWEATQILLAAVPGVAPTVLGLDEASQVERSIIQIYRSRERVEQLLVLTEQGYSTDRQLAEASREQVIALLNQAESEMGN